MMSTEERLIYVLPRLEQLQAQLEQQENPSLVNQKMRPVIAECIQIAVAKKQELETLQESLEKDV